MPTDEEQRPWEKLESLVEDSDTQHVEAFLEWPMVQENAFAISISRGYPI